MSSGLLEFANRMPPCLCRLLARKNRGRTAMTHDDIADASGLSRETVIRLSYKESWSGVRIDTADKFALACGVNLTRIERPRDFLRRKKMAYVSKAKGRTREVYAKMFKAGQT